MADLDADRIIQSLSQKIAQAAVREAIQEAYAEQLEKQIASLQEQLRGGSHGMVEQSNQEDAGQADRESDKA